MDCSSKIICLLVFVCCSQSLALNLTALPDAVVPGLTSELEVTCSLPNGAPSGISTLMSLILSKSGSTPIYNEVATVTSASGENVTVLSDLGADNITGRVSSTGDSFITFHWDNPEHEARGRYKCVAFGVDKLGHPITEEVTTEVKEQEVNLDFVVDKLRELTSSLNASNAHNDLIKAQLNATVSELNKAKVDMNTLVHEVYTLKTNHVSKSDFEELKANMSACCSKTQDLNSNMGNFCTKSEIQTVSNSLSACCAEAQNKSDIVLTRLNNSEAVMMESVFQTDDGHKYLVSHQTSWSSHLVPHRLCQLYGGYVVAIDDQHEYQQIVQQLEDHHINDYILTGSHEEDDRTWTLPNTGGKQTYFNWSTGEPNKYLHRCMYLQPGNAHFSMFDEACERDCTGRFICEMDN